MANQSSRTLRLCVSGRDSLHVLSVRAGGRGTTLLLFALLLSIAGASADEAVVYAPLPLNEAKSRTTAWLTEHASEDEELRKAVEALWQFDDSNSTVEARFDAVMQSFYLADPAVRELVDTCASQPIWALPPTFEVLEASDQDGDNFFLQNVRFFYARYLAVGGAYDEALAHFAQIDPEQLVDPASCLFYQAVCEHGLLQKEEGLKSIKSLLEKTQDVPQRYRTIAKLMQADLEALKEKSLSEVAQQMKDVRRRLSLGHGGPRVQGVEEKIIATLDELIENLESQQSSSSSSPAGGQGSPDSNRSQSPLPDSQIAGGSGPGEVDPRDLGKGSNWGGLPPKEETAAKQLINRQFPPHYRQAVEEYLKKLSERTAPRR